MPDTDISTLQTLEETRCAALRQGDDSTLEAMLDDSLVHIHLNGKIDDKAGYLHGFRDLYTFIAVRRGPLTIRVFGDAAVMTGALIQTILVRATGQNMDVTAITTQVWNRTPQGWRLNTCHNAPSTV